MGQFYQLYSLIYTLVLAVSFAFLDCLLSARSFTIRFLTSVFVKTENLSLRLFVHCLRAPAFGNGRISDGDIVVPYVDLLCLRTENVEGSEVDVRDSPVSSDYCFLVYYI